MTLASLGCATAVAHAATITDGGFEAAGGGNVYFAGQSLDGGAWNVALGSVYIDSADAYVFDGLNSLNLTYANLYTPNSVTQSFATTAGLTYNVSFYGNADTANTFLFSENGLAVAGLPTSIANNGFPGAVTNSLLFTRYAGSFVANAPTTTLRLTSTGSPAIGSANGSVIVDDVSVQAATPEPQSFILLLTGLAGVGGSLTRRRRQRQS